MVLVLWALLIASWIPAGRLYSVGMSGCSPFPRVACALVDRRATGARRILLSPLLQCEGRCRERPPGPAQHGVRAGNRCRVERIWACAAAITTCMRRGHENGVKLSAHFVSRIFCFYPVGISAITRSGLINIIFTEKSQLCRLRSWPYSFDMARPECIAR